MQAMISNGLPRVTHALPYMRYYVPHTLYSSYNALPALPSFLKKYYTLFLIETKG